LQLVALAAATRAALVAPYSGIAAVLGALGPTFASGAPALAQLAAVAQDSAQRGTLLALAEAPASPDEANVPGIAAFQDQARALLGRQANTSAVRGERIWRAWTETGGVVHELLGPVCAGETARASAVAQKVASLGRDAEQAAAVNSADVGARRGPHKLDGWARQMLIARLRDALAIAGGWAQAVGATSQAKPADPGQHAATVAQAFRSGEATVMKELQVLACSGDPLMAGAARGAQLLYKTTFELVRGASQAGPELDGPVVLNQGLLKSDVALDDQGEPIEPGRLDAGSVAVAARRSWEEAFEARTGTGDHQSTKGIVAALESTEPALARALGQRRDGLVETERSEVGAKVSVMLGRLDSARRAGLLDETDAGVLDNQLHLAGAKDRLDFATIRAELAQVEQSLGELAEAATEEFRDRLAASAAEHEAVAQALSHFDELLKAGDVATSEELLLQLEQGVTQPSSSPPLVDFEKFFPAVVEALPDGLSDELLETVRRRGRFGPLDFSELSSDAATDRAGALAEWLAVSKGERQANKARVLASSLRLLGIEFAGEKNPALRGSNERSWVDLTGVTKVPQALVPAFGSGAGDEQRLLLVWKQPGEALLNWVEPDVSGKALIVLYFGTLSVEARRRVTENLRRRAAQPVVIIDDAVVAWAASLGRSTFEVTMRATLPFSSVNPYEPGIAGAVPEEMFYGREAELAEVALPRGTCLIYGGRRLGKSALLRAAQRNFKSTPAQQAVYIDLANKGLGASARPQAVWDLISLALIDAGIAERPGLRRAAPDPFDHASRAIRNWLAAGSSRRFLLLLDECDDFFDLDAKAGFAQTRRLKDLMEDEGTQRRFKVVFAGLHQVARFSSLPNQPLPHLGKPLAIGPLSPPPAHKLVVKPITALGWRFESDYLVSRVLAYTNYIPILIQEFGRSLINYLHAKPLEPGAPPSVITASDIDQVLESGGLAEAIKDRFQLTLSLDPRYKAIAYILAYRAWRARREDMNGRPETARALLDEARDWWPAVFGEVSSDEFRALLEELSGLGVLSKDRSGSWQVRSPNVLRLLGSQREVEDRLGDLVSEDPPAKGMVSGDARRPLTDEGGKRSPFSEAMLADLIGEGHNQLRVVIGTEAMSAELCAAALSAAHKLTTRWGLVVASKRSIFSRAVAEMNDKGHRVVFTDLGDGRAELVTEAIAACTKVPSLRGATRAVVIVVSPAALGTVEFALAASGVADAAIVTLRRYNMAALRAWALETESGFAQDDTILARAMAVTGGWPVLVQQLEMDARSQGARRALTGLERSLSEDPGRLVVLAGLKDGPLADAYAVAAELLGPQGKEPLEALGPMLADDPEQGEALAWALVATGALTQASDGALSVEPVLLAAWAASAGKADA
jgi:hypothetical protein